MKSLTIILMSIIIFFNCTDKKELNGIYIVSKLNFSIDTLKLNNNGTYYRTVFRKKDNKLIFKNSDNWEYENGRITLHNFLQNSDSDFANEIPDFSDVLITSSLPVLEKSGSIIIYYRTGHYENFYIKLE